MCTSIVSNRKKTIVGWNLDILDLEYKVFALDDKVYIAIKDAKKGFIPLFGAKANGDFVTMPTCHPFDDRSDASFINQYSVIGLNSDVLQGKKTFSEVKKIVEENPICSGEDGVTFMAQNSDLKGNVLQIIPGQGYNYLEKPLFSILTNFSPFKGDKDNHPWMGMDRYNVAFKMLEDAKDTFDVKDCFEVLKATSQTICPTVVSMVFSPADNMVYWCENREWNSIKQMKIKEK